MVIKEKRTLGKKSAKTYYSFGLAVQIDSSHLRIQKAFEPMRPRCQRRRRLIIEGAEQDPDL